MTVLLLSITIAVYLASRRLYKNVRVAVLTPVFTSTAAMIVILLVFGISLDTYEPVIDLVTAVLGPATVALAVPVYKHRKIILRYSRAFLWSLTIGSLTAALISLSAANLIYLSSQLITSLTVKSATVPIALELAELQGGDLTMTAVFVMITGLIGAVFGPGLLTIAGVNSPAARGMAVGTIAHGIGTAHIINEGELQGASAAAAMACAGIFLSLITTVL
ncbi:LrgB family protein [Alkalicoccus saliphilus]|uniref:LrgB family protein n=1 Tax=Alkalicoccus saliphilus TaxID=200989 RepID=A0A2T4UA25_9BACI|nr:LrgB family protein [Alkalicoccus saliphilus]PTL40258.1 hypothetical protein C6Y45_02440 [Alkalicoccus saliphilus]